MDDRTAKATSDANLEGTFRQHPYCIYICMYDDMCASLAVGGVHQLFLPYEAREGNISSSSIIFNLVRERYM